MLHLEQNKGEQPHEKDSHAHRLRPGTNHCRVYLGGFCGHHSLHPFLFACFLRQKDFFSYTCYEVYCSLDASVTQPQKKKMKVTQVKREKRRTGQ
jgi:hypothetical protein